MLNSSLWWSVGCDPRAGVGTICSPLREMPMRLEEGSLIAIENPDGHIVVPPPNKRPSRTQGLLRVAE